MQVRRCSPLCASSKLKAWNHYIGQPYCIEHATKDGSEVRVISLALKGQLDVHFANMQLTV